MLAGLTATMLTQPRNNEWIDLREAAELSGYHPDYLGQLIRAGKLPADRLGKAWVVQRGSIARLSSQRRGGNRAELLWAVVFSALASALATATLVLLDNGLL